MITYTVGEDDAYAITTAIWRYARKMRDEGLEALAARYLKLGYDLTEQRRSQMEETT